MDGKLQQGVTYRASATIRYDHEMDGVDSSAVTSHLFYVAIQYADGTINRVATGTVKRGETTTITGEFSIHPTLMWKVPNSLSKPRGVRKARAWITSSTIFP